MTPQLAELRRRLAVRTRRLLDTGALTPPPPSDPPAAEVSVCRPARPVLQILYGRYLAARPIDDIQCAAQTRRRHRCHYRVLAPDTPARIWTLMPATATRGQLALPAADMAVYDLTHIPYAEQLRWSTQRCPAHAAAPQAADLALAEWEVFDPLLHHWQVDGLFLSRGAPPPTPLHLVGCEAAEPLLAVLRGPRKWDRDWMQLWALDRQGRVMYRHSVYLRIETARPSVLGGSLVDITLTDGGDDRPPLLARPIWEAWYQGVPTTPNLWAPYSAQGRSAWLDLTATGMGGQGPDRSGGTYHLDGRFVTDVPGLHCAMAEALVGPGGYFGREWNAFKDCLGGGFGLAVPFTLIWHDADIARQALADVVSDPDEGLTYFEDIVQLLERCSVTVVLQ